MLLENFFRLAAQEGSLGFLSSGTAFSSVSLQKSINKFLLLKFTVVTIFSGFLVTVPLPEIGLDSVKFAEYLWKVAIAEFPDVACVEALKHGCGY